MVDVGLNKSWLSKQERIVSGGEVKEHDEREYEPIDTTGLTDWLFDQTPPFVIWQERVELASPFDASLVGERVKPPIRADGNAQARQQSPTSPNEESRQT